MPQPQELLIKRFNTPAALKTSEETIHQDVPLQTLKVKLKVFSILDMTGGTSSQVVFALKKVKKDFKDAFGNVYILKWILWWALAMCGNFQVTFENDILGDHFSFG